jgi:DUF2911 family protein
MKYKLAAFALLIALAQVSLAQETKPAVQAFSSPDPDERASTRVLFWDTVKKGAAGEVAIDYGRPVWKKEYESAMLFDPMTKGKVWRFGKDFWTTLDTNLPLRIGGKEIPPGYWYLGLHRSDDGATWSLAFLDPAKVRAARLDAFEVTKAPVEFKVPVTLEKASESKDKLTILLSTQENRKEVTLKISWGTLQLTTPIQVSL